MPKWSCEGHHGQLFCSVNKKNLSNLLIYRSIYLIYPSVNLSICQSVCLSTYLCHCRFIEAKKMQAALRGSCEAIGLVYEVYRCSPMYVLCHMHSAVALCIINCTSFFSLGLGSELSFQNPENGNSYAHASLHDGLRCSLNCDWRCFACDWPL